MKSLIAVLVQVLVGAGTAQAQILLPEVYPDVFRLMIHIESEAPTLLNDVQKFMREECTARQARLQWLCEFHSAYEKFTARTNWVSNGQRTEDGIHEEFVEIQKRWKEVDIRGLLWTLGYDASNDPVRQQEIVLKVFEWIQLKRKLRTEAVQVKDIVGNWPQSLPTSAERIVIPLIESWLTADFDFARVLVFSKSMTCKKMAVCEQASQALQDLTLEVLREYESRISDIYEYLLTPPSAFHDEIQRRIYQVLKQDDHVQVAMETTGVIPKGLIEEVRSWVHEPTLFSAQNVRRFIYALQIKEMRRTLERNRHHVHQPHPQAALFSGYPKLRDRLVNEVAQATKFFENEFVELRNDLGSRQ